MAEERKISTNLDLTIDEAVLEYKELQEYRKSKDWVNSVIERIERRMADLAKLVIESYFIKCSDCPDEEESKYCEDKTCPYRKEGGNGLNS